MTVGEKIKQMRIELGLSQDDLAKRVGYKSRSSIQKIENARRLPLPKVEVMAKALECSPSYLMGWLDEEETPTTHPVDTFDSLLTREIYKHFTDEELNDPVLSKQIGKFLVFLKTLDSKGRDALLTFAQTLISRS